MKDEKKSDVHLHAASKNTSDPVRPGGSLFSLAEICETAISSVLKETLQKNTGVSLSIDPSVPNYVKGDAEQLRNILRTALANEMAGTPSGPVVLSAVTGRFSPGGVEIRFSISGGGNPFSFRLPFEDAPEEQDCLEQRNHQENTVSPNPETPIVFLMETTGSDREFAEHMALKFLTAAPRLMDDLRQASGSGDWEILRSLAHRIKGNFACFGNRRGEEIALAMEESVLTNGREDITPLLLPLIAEIKLLVRSIQKETGTGKTES